MNKNQDTKQEKVTTLELPRCEYSHCGKQFIPTGPRQKYCSEAHRVKAFQERQKDKR